MKDPEPKDFMKFVSRPDWLRSFVIKSEFCTEMVRWMLSPAVPWLRTIVINRNSEPTWFCENFKPEPNACEPFVQI